MHIKECAMEIQGATTLFECIVINIIFDRKEILEHLVGKHLDNNKYSERSLSTVSLS